MIFLTVGDYYSGIFKSQVVDVCKYLSEISGEDVKLVSFISIRNYFEDRKKIKRVYQNSIVLPMYPKLKNWKSNIVLLWFIAKFYRPKKIISRGLIATNLALDLKQKLDSILVFFDARGAYKAEWTEYSVVGKELAKDVERLEKRAIYESDNRLAVSNSLVNYWKTDYGYNGKDYKIIPCTINADNLTNFSEEVRQKKRAELGFSPDDTVYVFSGSAAGWQSANLIDDLLLKLLEKENTKAFFMSKIELESLKSYQKYPEKMSKIWVKPNEVHRYLSAADFGILYRNQSVTNEVASPVKFGEYLSAGLKVLISENLGDYSEIVQKNNLGVVLNSSNLTSLEFRNDQNTRERLQNFAKNELTKERYKDSYLELI